MDVDFEFTVARLAKIANNSNFVGVLGNSGPSSPCWSRMEIHLLGRKGAPTSIYTNGRRS
jgi:hypothetical protein